MYLSIIDGFFDCFDPSGADADERDGPMGIPAIGDGLCSFVGLSNGAAKSFSVGLVLLALLASIITDVVENGCLRRLATDGMVLMLA